MEATLQYFSITNSLDLAEVTPVAKMCCEQSERATEKKKNCKAKTGEHEAGWSHEAGGDVDHGTGDHEAGLDQGQ